MAWLHPMVGQDAIIAVYILASGRNGTLYTRVTSALVAARLEAAADRGH